MKNTSYLFLRSEKKDANKFSTERKIMYRNENIMITMYLCGHKNEYFNEKISPIIRYYS